MISRLFPTKQLLWTSEKTSNMSGNFAFERSLKYKVSNDLYLRRTVRP